MKKPAQRIGSLSWSMPLLAVVVGLAACSARGPIGGGDAGTADLGLDPRTLGGIALGSASTRGGTGNDERFSYPVLRSCGGDCLAVFWTEFVEVSPGQYRSTLRLQRLDAAGKRTFPFRGKELNAQPATSEETSLYNVQVSREPEPWAITWSVAGLETSAGVFDRDGNGWQRAFPGVKGCSRVNRVGASIVGMCSPDWFEVPKLVWLNQAGSLIGPKERNQFYHVEQALGLESGLLEIYAAREKGCKLLAARLRLGATELESDTLVVGLGTSCLVEAWPVPVSPPQGRLHNLLLFEVALSKGAKIPTELRALGFDAAGEAIPLAGQPHLLQHKQTTWDQVLGVWVSGATLHTVTADVGARRCTYIRKDLRSTAPGEAHDFQSTAVCGSFPPQRATRFAGHTDGFTALRGGVWIGTEPYTDPKARGEWQLLLERYDAQAKLRYSKVLHRRKSGTAYDIVPDGQGGAYVLWGVPSGARVPVVDGVKLWGDALVIQRFDKDGKPLWPKAGPP